MRLVRRGKVDVIVCFKLDRLGRSLAHLAQLIAEFRTNRAAFVCTSQGIDTSTSNPAAQLQLNILCAVAEFEREIIRERVNAGLKAARARGLNADLHFRGFPYCFTRAVDILLTLSASLMVFFLRRERSYLCERSDSSRA
jgi:DNA invertase Pin-like site-specific DNA recombinase